LPHQNQPQSQSGVKLQKLFYILRKNSLITI
jgi:hypothetical protein